MPSSSIYLSGVTPRCIVPLQHRLQQAVVRRYSVALQKWAGSQEILRLHEIVQQQIVFCRYELEANAPGSYRLWIFVIAAPLIRANALNSCA